MLISWPSFDAKYQRCMSFGSTPPASVTTTRFGSPVRRYASPTCSHRSASGWGWLQCSASWGWQGWRVWLGYEWIGAILGVFDVIGLAAVFNGNQGRRRDDQQRS